MFLESKKQKELLLRLGLQRDVCSWEQEGEESHSWQKLDEKCVLRNCISLLCLNCLKKTTRFSAAGASADARKK